MGISSFGAFGKKEVEGPGKPTTPPLSSANRVAAAAPPPDDENEEGAFYGDTGGGEGENEEEASASEPPPPAPAASAAPPKPDPAAAAAPETDAAKKDREEKEVLRVVDAEKKAERMLALPNSEYAVLPPSEPIGMILELDECSNLRVTPMRDRAHIENLISLLRIRQERMILLRSVGPEIYSRLFSELRTPSAVNEEQLKSMKRSLEQVLQRSEDILPYTGKDVRAMLDDIKDELAGRAAAAATVSPDADLAARKMADHNELLAVEKELPDLSKEVLAKLAPSKRDADIRKLERLIGCKNLSQEESERATALVNQLRAVKERAIVFSSVGDKIFARAFKDVTDAPLEEARNALEQLLLHGKTNFPNTAGDVESLLNDVKKEIADRKAAAAPAEPPPPVAPAAAEKTEEPKENAAPVASPEPKTVSPEPTTTTSTPTVTETKVKPPVVPPPKKRDVNWGMIIWALMACAVAGMFIFAVNHDWEADPSTVITDPHRDPAPPPAPSPAPHTAQPPAPVHTPAPAQSTPPTQPVPAPQPETRCVPAAQAPVACNPTDPREAVTRHATWNCDHAAISRYPDGTYDLCQCRWCETPAPVQP